MPPLPVIISGLAMGCIYALVALGYVFIWNSMAIINFKFEPNGDGNHQIHMVEDRKGEAKWVSTVKF